MLVLALDTTTRAGGMALCDGTRLIESRVGDPTVPHASRLPGGLMALLSDHGRDLADVDLYAVAAGPGSFTGLRIGLATMQGLALAGARPLVGVPALEALAVSAAARLGAGSHPIAAWMDAQRGEVFSGVYLVGIDDGGLSTLTVLDPPVSAPPADVVSRWHRDGCLEGLAAAGEGAVRYGEVLRANLPGLVAQVIESPVPIAPAVASLALREWSGGGSFRPEAIRPIYVRRPDAELARDRRRDRP